ncbi:DJ-1/PfpI family protein [uncultured Cohaesibacter sp.]|uniref:DJ-1/PfpI family protein n=1 Tax=uncultured Cohaesibacter sp. TaxID=1002546 RepID=UPI002AAB1992|nr:DJ-1/PfpI family protein [uncultured Cohaesibacter sp.]
MGMKIGILIFEDVEELDFVGPWEVFTMTNAVSIAKGEEPLFEMALIAPDVEPVTCAKGMRVLPDKTMADTDGLDVILVPGGQGTRREVNNPAIINWIAEIGQGAQWVTSVCTGSLLLTAAGLTKGKKITTHHGAVDLVKARPEKPDVRGEYRYVRDGNLVTSAGVSAGIDMSLWLVGEWYGPDFARAVQKAMQYDPVPPYSALT